MYYSTPEISSEADNQSNSQASKDNLYHLDVMSGKYYSDTQSHTSRDTNNQEVIQLEPQQTIEDWTEIRQPEPQSSASPIYNVPMDQLLYEF